MNLRCSTFQNNSFTCGTFAGSFHSLGDWCMIRVAHSYRYRRFPCLMISIVTWFITILPDRNRFNSVYYSLHLILQNLTHRRLETHMFTSELVHHCVRWELIVCSPQYQHMKQRWHIANLLNNLPWYFYQKYKHLFSINLNLPSAKST